MSIRVYKYGLRRPTVNGPIVEEQIRLASRYRNVLVEIERGRRAALRGLMRDSNERTRELEELARTTEVERQAAYRDMQAARASTRSRSETAEQKLRVKTANATHRDAVRALREQRTIVRNSGVLRAAEDNINDLAATLQRSARAYCGVYWGVYLIVEAAMQMSRKMPLYIGAEPNDPFFVRYGGFGQIGVQLQGGLDAALVFGNDTQIRIKPVDERAWHSPHLYERRRYSKTTLQIRIGSDERRAPIWAEFPMTMHRPLPDGAVIKMATVSKCLIGPRDRWQVEMTVDTTAVRPAESAASGVVAIDLGWRQIGGDLRVATYCTDAGETGELRLSAQLLSSLSYHEKLRAIRDRNFNDARAALKTWLTESKEAGLALPEWLTLGTDSLMQWRDIGRLAARARQWKTNRFDGDTVAYEALEAWRYHDYHLWTWETSQQTKSILRRRDLYRTWGAKLATRFAVVVFEDFDITRIAKRAAPEAKAENETARGNRFYAATGGLRSIVENAFQSRGRTTERESAVNTTRECNACHVISTFDAAAHITHECPGCHVVWDQDENAARNLLDRRAARLAAPTAPSTPGTAPTAESKWLRARRMAAEKKERAATVTGPAE